MTFTLSVHLRGQVRFTQSWRRHCVRRLASTSTSIKPSMTDALRCAAGWWIQTQLRGDWGLPPNQQGPQGSWSAHRPHPSFITTHMAAKFKEQALLFERIPLIEDVQVGWLLLVFCAATRANYWLRTVPPEHTSECCGASAASCRWTGCFRTHVRQHPCL